jgi:mannose-6-phosphate isomerase-like protein (cupin superfamily)
MTKDLQKHLSPAINERNDREGGSHLNEVQSRHFLRGHQTGGVYSVSEIVFQPSGHGTPLHVHHREEELYYVLEGQLEVRVGERKFLLESGGSVLLPRGVPHKVWPIGNVTTRVLMVVSPPTLIDMLVELDRLNASGEMNDEAMQRLAKEYAIDFLPE